MFQTQMITKVVEWERRLEYEAENRKYHQSEPYTNYLAPLQAQPARRERRSLLAWLFRPRRKRQPAYAHFPEPCQENQPG